jgi:hypothetical protein
LLGAGLVYSVGLYTCLHTLLGPPFERKERGGGAGGRSRYEQLGT